MQIGETQLPPVASAVLLEQTRTGSAPLKSAALVSVSIPLPPLSPRAVSHCSIVSLAGSCLSQRLQINPGFHNQNYS